MFDLDTIADLSREAGVTAAATKAEPFVIFSAATVAADLRRAPSLGDYLPAGWRRARCADLDLVDGEKGVDESRDPDDGVTLFCDATGGGAEDEPALTLAQVAQLVTRALAAANRTDNTLGVAIVSAGQFQIYLGLFLKTPRLRLVEGGKA